MGRPIREHHRSRCGLCTRPRCRHPTRLRPPEQTPNSEMAVCIDYRDCPLRPLDLLALLCDVPPPGYRGPLFSNPEDFDNIIRMMVIFSLFGGVYIAEVIRGGGLQAVDSGQKEAAMALGLTPTRQSDWSSPNAIRTTLPTIVSQFIGLWKDTTLLL